MADSVESKEEKIEDLRDGKVVTKYKAAADIAQEALKFAISQAVPGKNIHEICVATDTLIKDRTSKIYNKPKTEKGVAFPTSISVNHIVGHFSPLAENKTTLTQGDLAKIDLGVHVDGYTALVAHSLLVGVENPDKENKASRVLAATYTASQLALRMLKPGNKNTAVTEMIRKVAADYKVNAVQGVLSHEMKKFVIDGQKVILNRADVEQKVDEVEFQPNEVYAIDIVMSTGEGKPIEGEDRPMVYKRADQRYNLKFKASRQVFGEIIKNHPTYPFNIRDLDPKTRNFAIKECREHELLHPYPILLEKEGEFVAHFKFTALLLPTGTIQVTGVPVDLAKLQTTTALKDEALLKLLQTAAGKKKKKKKGKGKKKGDGGGRKDEDEEDDDEGDED